MSRPISDVVGLGMTSDQVFAFASASPGTVSKDHPSPSCSRMQWSYCLVCLHGSDPRLPSHPARIAIWIVNVRESVAPDVLSIMLATHSQVCSKQNLPFTGTLLWLLFCLGCRGLFDAAVACLGAGGGLLSPGT